MPEIPDMAGFDIPDMVGRKTRRRRTQSKVKRFAFYANAKIIHILQFL